MNNFAGYFFPVVLLFVCCYSTKDEYDWKCTDEFCQGVKCPDLPEECMDSKKSYLIPSIEPCNCCTHCFVFLDEGDDCQQSNADLQVPTVMCGPGLTCSNQRKCVKMAEERKDPDFYPNYKCEQDMCYCHVINEFGNEVKIFGQFKKSKLNENETQCECSVVAHRAMKMELRVFPFEEMYQPTVRCLPNGQFDPLQCIGDFCGCVDKETGTPDENGFTYYILSLERNNPKCFDPARHKRGDYYTPCEKKRNKLMQEINEKSWKDVNFIHFKKINCNPDGSDVIEN